MPSPGPAVLAHALCYAYDDADVLHDVSVELRSGEVTAVVGPNGSGKSTLVELLAGVLRPRCGLVRRAADVALVVQRPAPAPSLPITVADTVAMGTWARGEGRKRPLSRTPSRTRTRERTAEAIARVELTGLESRPLSSLSGGQRQRALLAQGIVRRPGILLLDEPAAGLDARSRECARAILAEEAAHGTAVACVTHDEDVIAVADQIIRLDRGRRVMPGGLDGTRHDRHPIDATIDSPARTRGRAVRASSPPAER
ncbi:zinc/manganese transport system ATP-binding protein [Microbacterium resistens]|uniref:Zinc/manganese transport system ATP-binding protein n=1 Tax=Microbacterium resistens TaxID=156977 RepID=A0ABU1SCX7_9MICO|nr:ATP-binding cassette domain-containing protein [Microbacterium resistens]MDR6867459.1 zinc/manganese transport system ATP-binding protein [Microbacterium resistens]